MLAVILNQHLIKRRKQEEYKTAHSSPPDYETRDIVSSSDGVSCAEKDEYYNSHLLDTKYAEETWKYCCDSVSSLKLVTKVFFFINNKNEDVNECIHKRGSAICYFLIEDLKKSVNKYIEGDSTARQKVRLRGINRRKEILLSIVNSGLLQEDALALVSDFIAAFDVSAIANAAAEQQKKIDKKEEKKD